MLSSVCAIDTPVQSPRSAHQRSCRARHASTASALGTSAHPPRSTRQRIRSAQHASTAVAAAPDTLVATQRQQQATQRRPQKDRRCVRAPHRRVLRLRPSYAQQTMQRHFHSPHNRRRSASFTPPADNATTRPRKRRRQPAPQRRPPSQNQLCRTRSQSATKCACPHRGRQRRCTPRRHARNSRPSTSPACPSERTGRSPTPPAPQTPRPR